MEKFDRLRAFIAGELDLPPDDLTPDMRLGELLTDSLGFVELTLAIEEEGLEVSEDLPDTLGDQWREMTLWGLADHLV